MDNINELINKIYEKLLVIFQYDEKYLRVIKKENLQVTYKYNGDEEELIRLLYKNGDFSVGVTRFEILTVNTENDQLKSESRMMYEGWDELLNK